MFPWVMETMEEVQAIAQVSERLSSRFPDTPADDIKQLVAQVHRDFDGRPIRDFVPVLVEREVVDQLRGQRGSREAANA